MTPSPLPIPPLRSQASAGDLLTGLRLPFRSLKVILQHRDLLRLSLTMAAVTAVILFALVWSLLTYTDDLVAWLWTPPERAWLLGLWWVVTVAIGLLLAVLGALILPPLALSPLADPLSEATEVHAGGTAPPFRWKDLWIGTWVGLKHTLVRLALTLLVVVLLLPLNLIPGVGSLLYAGLSGLWGMLALTAEHLGAPLARHRYPSRTVFRVMRARPALSVGFGLGVWGILIVPVLNAFFLPLAIVGGTLLYLGLERAEALPARSPAS